MGCEENKCTEVPVTTGLTTVTEVDTIYTTYCPLPSTEAPESSAPETKAQKLLLQLLKLQNHLLLNLNLPLLLNLQKLHQSLHSKLVPVNCKLVLLWLVLLLCCCKFI